MKNKILTNPPEAYESLYDNVDKNLILRRGDYLLKNANKKYMIINILGTGTFSQVARCIDGCGEEVAIKIVKNSRDYYHHEMNEVNILQKLMLKGLTKHFVVLKDAFMFKEHLCIVQELLGYNLYEMIKITGFKGFDHAMVQKIGRQILEGLRHLSMLGISHCDLKPENILVTNYTTFDVKIIDFGSAFSSPQQTNFYVQSRYYRSPEVILGIPYSTSCDIWSFGCILYEIYVGSPLFPGQDNTDLIGKIYKLCNGLPRFMLEHGENTHVFFEKENNFRVLNAPEGMCMNMMLESIRCKTNNTELDDQFIEILLKCINPNHLNRSASDELLSHRYMTAIETTVTKEVCARNQPAPVPRLGKQRRNSEFNITPSKKVKETKRKHSVYDMTNENKSNY